jgi:hypothetical protein
MEKIIRDVLIDYMEENGFFTKQMIPVLVKSVWLRNICFSKLATTLFKFIDRFP